MISRQRMYYISIVLLLPWSILFFGIGIIGILLEALGEKMGNVGEGYKHTIIKLIKDIERAVNNG